MSVRTRMAFAAIAGSCLLSAVSAIAAGAWWPAFRVNDESRESQSIAEGVAQDAAGNFTVAWNDGKGKVWRRRMSPGGVPFGPPAQVDPNVLDGNGNAALAMDGTGRFAIAWIASPWGSDHSVVRVARYTAWGAPRGITSFGQFPFVYEKPQLAMNEAGDYVVAWPQDGVLHARVFAFNGEAFGDEFTLPGLDDVSLTSARTVVAAAMTDQGAKLQCFGADGVAKAPATTLPLGLGATPPDVWYGESRVDTAVVQDDRIVVAWTERGVQNTSTSVQVRQVASDCVTTLWAAEVDNGLVVPGGPQVTGYRSKQAHFGTSSDPGRIVVTWISTDPTTAHDTGYVRMLDLQGAALGDKQAVTSGTFLFSPLSVAATDAGELTAAWDHLAPGGTQRNVYVSGTGTGGADDDGTRDFSVSLESSGPAIAGAQFGYTATLTNNSSFASNGMTVEIDVPEGVELVYVPWPCRWTRPVVCEYPYETRPAFPYQWSIGVRADVPGTYTAVATVTGAEPDPGLDDNRSELTTNVVAGAADLSVYTWADQVYLGDVVPMRISVYNGQADGDATGVTASLAFTQLQYEGVETPGWSCAPTAEGASCTADAAMPQASSTELRVLLRAPGVPGTFRVTTQVSSDLFDPNTQNNVHQADVYVRSLPVDLSVALEAPSQVAPGSDAEVVVTVTNHEPGTLDTGFVSAFQVPDGFMFKSSSGTNWECNGPFCRYQGLLRGGESASHRITLTAPTTLGKYAMSTTVTATELETSTDNNSASAPIEVAVCGISDTSSDPKPHYKLKTNNGVDFHFHMGDDGVCDVRVK